MSDNPVQILAVCTGNVCRSPFTEHLLRSGLARAGIADVFVHSAGTHALAGRPMVRESAAQLLSAGADDTGFTARQLDAAMVRAATVVLALTRAHRGPIVEQHPAAARVTFTVREFARLLAGVSAADVAGRTAADRLRSVVDLAVRRRGTLPPVEPQDDDVTDPYGKDISAHQLMAAQIAPAVATILGLVTP